MERADYGRGFEETLRLCQKVTKTYRGSKETLRHIKRIEECLKRLVNEAN
ncbi:MAG: hypothetical protein PVF15_10075 [Candidatus Bathyarchaeota archaeon]